MGELEGEGMWLGLWLWLWPTAASKASSTPPLAATTPSKAATTFFLPTFFFNQISHLLFFFFAIYFFAYFFLATFVYIKVCKSVKKKGFIVLVLLSASVERVGVSHMRDFFLHKVKKCDINFKFLTRIEHRDVF